MTIVSQGKLYGGIMVVTMTNNIGQSKIVVIKEAKDVDRAKEVLESLYRQNKKT